MAHIKKSIEYSRIGMLVLVVLLMLYAGMTENWLAVGTIGAWVYYLVEYYNAKNYIGVLKYHLYQADEFIESMLDEMEDDDVSAKE